MTNFEQGCLRCFVMILLGGVAAPGGHTLAQWRWKHRYQSGHSNRQHSVHPLSIAPWLTSCVDPWLVFLLYFIVLNKFLSVESSSMAFTGSAVMARHGRKCATLATDVKFDLKVNPVLFEVFRLNSRPFRSLASALPAAQDAHRASLVPPRKMVIPGTCNDLPDADFVDPRKVQMTGSCCVPKEDLRKDSYWYSM